MGDRSARALRGRRHFVDVGEPADRYRTHGRSRPCSGRSPCCSGGRGGCWRCCPHHSLSSRTGCRRRPRSCARRTIRRRCFVSAQSAAQSRRERSGSAVRARPDGSARPCRSAGVTVSRRGRLRLQRLPSTAGPVDGPAPPYSLPTRCPRRRTSRVGRHSGTPASAERLAARGERGMLAGDDAAPDEGAVGQGGDGDGVAGALDADGGAGGDEGGEDEGAAMARRPREGERLVDMFGLVGARASRAVPGSILAVPFGPSSARRRAMPATLYTHGIQQRSTEDFIELLLAPKCLPARQDGSGKPAVMRNRRTTGSLCSSMCEKRHGAANRTSPSHRWFGSSKQTSSTSSTRSSLELPNGCGPKRCRLSRPCAFVVPLMRDSRKADAPCRNSAIS